MTPVPLSEVLSTASPEAQARIREQIGATEIPATLAGNSQVSTSVMVTVTPQEVELMRLHQSATRDTTAIGMLLIEMRSTQPRGEWTAYLEGVGTRTGISRSSLFRYIAKIENPEKPKKVTPPDFRTAKSPDGHTMGTLQSWLQKAIRRNEERQALYVAKQFHLTGFDGAILNICLTAASEDIGLAERGLVPELVGIHAAYKIEKARKSEDLPERLQLTQAVLLCCRAAKSRLVDHALIVGFEGSEVMQPPDWVFDGIHTPEGTGTVADFFDTENAALNPKSDIPDPYRDEAEKIRTAKTKGGAQ